MCPKKSNPFEAKTPSTRVKGVKSIYTPEQKPTQDIKVMPKHSPRSKVESVQNARYPLRKKNTPFMTRNPIETPHELKLRVSSLVRVLLFLSLFIVALPIALDSNLGFLLSRDLAASFGFRPRTPESALGFDPQRTANVIVTLLDFDSILCR